MVIRETGPAGEGVAAPAPEVICIPQSQHALISGQIAAAWGNGEFPPPRPRAQAALSARRHDDGMDDFDSDPELDPDTGLPRSFMRMPVSLQVDCWRRGPELVSRDSPYAGILVSLHGSSLIGRRRLDADDTRNRRLVEDYLAEQDRVRAELGERAADEAGVEPEDLADEAIETNRRLLAAWDWMSLAVCIPRLLDEVPDVPGARGTRALRMESLPDGRVSVAPWPFAADRVALRAEGRRLERRYGSEAEMRTALAGAPAVAIEAELVPAD